MGRPQQPGTDAIGTLEHLVAEAHTGFDLATGPLFRIVLFRLTESDRVLLVAHHLVVDGVSWRILLSDLEDAYAAARRTESFENDHFADAPEACARNA